MSTALPAEERKSLGAFYTDEAVVRFLVGWGLRAPARSVMDPSCGDGRFLAVAGEQGVGRLVGCDLAAAAIRQTEERLGEGALRAEIYCQDFFSLLPESVAPVDLVVGNPPFIRYQLFNGETRQRGLRAALRAGVKLTKLSSSWAPFVLHALQFLREGGDLAMVIPAEITQTRYGLATLRALLGHFSAVSLLAFESNLFRDAQQETCLLLASGRGGRCGEVRLLPLSSVDDLEALSYAGTGAAIHKAVAVPVDEGKVVRFAEAFLTSAERRTWRQIRRHPEVVSLASLGTVTNGYVSGDNDFFHRTRQAAQEASLPATWLFPVARNSRSLTGGLFFTPEDVAAQEERGVAHHLVVPQNDLFSAEPAVLQRFTAEGERRGTARRFKCRSREPWWKVPGLTQAELLVTYMSGAQPRAAVNRARAFYANSLHGLRLRDGISAELLALALHSSLSLLSMEIEGRSYGGGILKLEPRELDRVLVPWPRIPPTRLHELSSRVDDMLRAGSYEEAVEAVDEEVLIGSLDLPELELRRLRSARRRLLARRTDRSRRRHRVAAG